MVIPPQAVNAPVQRPTLAQSPLYQAADQALADHGIPLQDHLLLRENVASYLAQASAESHTPPQNEVSPARSQGPNLQEILGQNSRWSYKLHRDLQKPYTDQQVFERLDQLEQSCQVLAASCFPLGRWYVSGSIPKGRFGAHSDVDLTCDAAFRPGQLEHLNQQGPWGAASFREEFQSGDPQLIYGSVHLGQEVSAVLVSGPLLERKLSEYDARVPLEVRTVEQEHGYLADLFVRALQHKGYQFERGPQGVTVIPPSLSPEHPPEKSWTRPGEK